MPQIFLIEFIEYHLINIEQNLNTLFLVIPSYSKGVQSPLTRFLDFAKNLTFNFYFSLLQKTALVDYSTKIIRIHSTFLNLLFSQWKAFLPATAMEEWRRLRGPDNLDCRHCSVTDSKQEVSDSNDFFLSFSQNRFSPQRYHFYIRLLPQNRQDPNWEIRKTKNWPKYLRISQFGPSTFANPGAARILSAPGFPNFSRRICKGGSKKW